MARLAAFKSTTKASSRITSPTVGISLMANVPTLKGSADPIACAPAMNGAESSAKATLTRAKSEGVDRGFVVIIFDSRTKDTLK